jgi:hypothetical protein
MSDGQPVAVHLKIGGPVGWDEEEPAREQKVRVFRSLGSP